MGLFDRFRRKPSKETINQIQKEMADELYAPIIASLQKGAQEKLGRKLATEEIINVFKEREKQEEEWQRHGAMPSFAPPPSSKPLERIREEREKLKEEREKSLREYPESRQFYERTEKEAKALQPETSNTENAVLGIATATVAGSIEQKQEDMKSKDQQNIGIFSESVKDHIKTRLYGILPGQNTKAHIPIETKVSEPSTIEQAEVGATKAAEAIGHQKEDIISSIANEIFNQNSCAHVVDCALTGAGYLYSYSQLLKTKYGNSEISKQLEDLADSDILDSKLMIAISSSKTPTKMYQELVERAMSYSPKFLNYLGESEKKQAEICLQNLRSARTLVDVTENFNGLLYLERNGFAIAHNKKDSQLPEDLEKTFIGLNENFSKKLTLESYDFLSSFDPELSHNIFSRDTLFKDKIVTNDEYSYGIRGLSFLVPKVNPSIEEIKESQKKEKSGEETPQKISDVEQVAAGTIAASEAIAYKQEEREFEEIKTRQKALEELEDRDEKIEEMERRDKEIEELEARGNEIDEMEKGEEELEEKEESEKY